MKTAGDGRLRPVLLSGLVFPGLGQLAQGHPWRALVFGGSSVALLVAVVRRVMRETERLLPTDADALLDPALPFRLAVEVHRANASFFLWVTLAIVALWLGSMADPTATPAAKRAVDVLSSSAESPVEGRRAGTRTARAAADREVHDALAPRGARPLLAAPAVGGTATTSGSGDRPPPRATARRTIARSRARSRATAARSSDGRAPARVDRRLVEHLVRDPVADAGEQRLVEQHRLHRPAAPGEDASRAPGTGGRPSSGSKPRLARGCSSSGRCWRRMRPKRRGSGMARRVAVLHRDLHLPEAGPRGPVPVDLEGPGHPEVEERPRATIQLHPQVLALAADGLDAPAAQGRRRSARARRPSYTIGSRTTATAAMRRPRRARSARRRAVSTSGSSGMVGRG